MKKKLLFALIVLLAIPLMAFAGGAKEGAASGQITIGLTLPGLQFPFFVTMKNDFDAAAAKLGVKVVYIDAQNDSSKQAAAMESFVAQKVSGILISPMTTDSLVPSIEAAVKAGIPVASVDRKANTDVVLIHLGADNVEGGRAAARYIVDKLKGKGTVIELEGTPGSSPAIDRKKGFDEVIAQNPGIKILVSQTAEFNRAKANSVMENLMQAYPKFDAVFGANDEMIIGAIEAMSAAGVDPASKVTVGYDATTDALSYIKQGKLGATVDQFPGKQSSQALQYLVDYIKNKTQPSQKVIYLSPNTVTTAP
jgi:ribose transport system substrate-binding protein